MKEYFIIGNGVAAAGCVEGIRSQDPAGHITVLSEERHAVYCRPLISYYLEGKAKPETMGYRPADFYEKNGCTVHYGKKAQSISPQNKQVQTADGETFSFDALCLCTGAPPFCPPFSGLETVPRAFSFFTMDDAFALEKAVSPFSRVLIMGAGLIGLKCAEGLAGRAKSIAVCDLAPRVLSSILDDVCAAPMQQAMEERGISFFLGDTVAQFQKNRAILQSGKTIDFDVLVLAVGVRPNLGLAKAAGCQTDRGILIDAGCQTSLPQIFAAGDCAQGNDAISGESKVLAILPNAYFQGHCAGVNMAGGKTTFEKGMPMNAIGFFGQHALTAGCAFSAAQGGQMLESRPRPGAIKRLFLKDGFLTGFMLIGETDGAGIYTNLIRDAVPLSAIDFETMQAAPSLLAFGAEARKEKLGGAQT